MPTYISPLDPAQLLILTYVDFWPASVYTYSLWFSHVMMVSRMKPVIFSLLLALPLVVLAAPSERRHGGHHDEGKKEHKHGFAIKAHGTLLTLAFSFLYPAGVVLIRGGFKRGFLMHWTTQGGATAAALTGMLIMIVKAWERLLVISLHSNSRLHLRSVSYSFEEVLSYEYFTLTFRPSQNGKAGVHHYIGTALFIAVCLQVLLGYYHHVLFVKFRRRTFISYAHIVLGWIVVCGGWVNTFL